MNTMDFKIKGREYVQTKPLKAALNLLDKEDIESHIVVAFTRGAGYALQNQWISVKDKLPESTRPVFILCKTPTYNRTKYIIEYTVGSWNKNKGLHGEWSLQMNNLHVDYWMPIPELNVSDSDDM